MTPEEMQKRILELEEENKKLAETKTTLETLTKTQETTILTQRAINSELLLKTPAKVEDKKKEETKEELSIEDWAKTLKI